MRGKTIRERHWCAPHDFANCVPGLQERFIRELLEILWEAYDALRSELEDIEIDDDTERIEDDITEHWQPLISEALRARPHLPCYAQHKSAEFETRLRAPARPPEYDIAFVLYEDRNVKVPVEAKVLKTAGRVSEYVKEITENYLTCRYAPFLEHGAMAGYLLSGEPDTAFENIFSSLGHDLESHPDFPDRPQRRSIHVRIVPEGKDYPADFTCHHLMLSFATNSSADGNS